MADSRAPGNPRPGMPDGGAANIAEVVHLNSRTLLRRHLDGDENAFAEILTLYRGLVFSYIVRCGVASKAREDVFQEVFLKVHQSAGSYEADKPFEPWLYAITANAVRSYFRREAVRKKVFDDHAEEPAADSAPDGEALTYARQTSIWLEQQLGKLPLAQREAVLLCCVDQLSQKDAAEILNIPLNTLKTNLRRARAELAQALVRRNLVQARESSR